MQEVILKKVMFGGYDCADVMNHINALQIKLNRAKKDAEKLESLRAETERLRSEIAEKDIEISELSREISEREEDVKKNQPTKRFLRQAEECSENYIESARFFGNSVKDMTSEQIEDAKENIAAVQEYLDSVSMLLGETISSLSDLKKEYRSISKSYKEILRRTTAAEKKEKKTAPKKNEAKKTSQKPVEKKSARKSAKSDNSEALELIRRTEEKYNNI
ncbi:MAG: hypothetical protein PUE34_02165 [Clostridiaceae bacterium]|nr:hypothetical protein [Clostridiaceae bacterium]